MLSRVIYEAVQRCWRVTAVAKMSLFVLPSLRKLGIKWINKQGWRVHVCNVGTSGFARVCWRWRRGMIGDQNVTCVLSDKEEGEQEQKMPQKTLSLSVCPFLHLLILSICQQDSDSRLGEDWETVTKKIYMSVYLCSTPLLWLEPAAAKCVCLAGYVFFFSYAGSEKLHCVFLLAYANARGGCGRWGGAPPSSIREKGSFGANQRELQKPILTCSSKDAEEFLLLSNAGLCFPWMKNTSAADVAISVSDWREANTTSPWHLEMISQVGLV